MSLSVSFTSNRTTRTGASSVTTPPLGPLRGSLDASIICPFSATLLGSTEAEAGLKNTAPDDRPNAVT